jgi:hypothetical protein
VQAMNPDLYQVVAGKQCTKSVQKFYSPFNRRMLRSRCLREALA